MPVLLFERIVGPDLPSMWRWLASHAMDLTTEPARAIHPAAHTVASYLRQWQIDRRA